MNGHPVKNFRRDRRAFTRTAKRTRVGNLPQMHSPRGGSHL